MQISAGIGGNSDVAGRCRKPKKRSARIRHELLLSSNHQLESIIHGDHSSQYGIKSCH
jgi:hypothetical protein